MTRVEIPRYRLHSQGISAAPFQKPDQVVRSLVAVQAQDYAAAKWALGLRMRSAMDDDVEQAFADGSILRTHVMRPTWHFVAPEDIRWLLQLTAPRVHAANAYQYRRLGLGPAVFKLSNAALTHALRGGKQLTRLELGSKLQQAGIDTSDLRLAYLIMSAELDGVICSGARRGKQFTYALLEERVPAAKALDREEALAELARRYFMSHGPATEQDLAWWSGLAIADVNRGLEMVKRRLAHEAIDGRTYWFDPSGLPSNAKSRAAYLLPNFDEYLVGYADRSAVFDANRAKQVPAREGNLANAIVIRGQVEGIWKRRLIKRGVVIESRLFRSLTNAEGKAVAAALRKYCSFLQRQLEEVKIS